MNFREICCYFLLYSCFCLGVFVFFSQSETQEEQHTEFQYFNEDDRELWQERVQELIFTHRYEQYQKTLWERFLEMFIPTSFSDVFPRLHREGMQSFFRQEDLLRELQQLKVFHHHYLSWPRWKMKKWHIHLYGASELSAEEYIAVAIHEFAHFHDIHIFDSQFFRDTSQEFYNLSWDGIYERKADQSPKDFVSGYAMTNRYEDFAESYTFFVLHQRVFEVQAKDSEILQKKYDFFIEHIDFLQLPDISLAAPDHSYSWDITKISYDYEKFLQYFQSEIQ